MAEAVDRPVDPDGVRTLADLAEVLRQLRRRHARRNHDSELTVRELARRSGYAYSVISEYLSGKVLAPTDRFDVLIRLLGASAAEQRALATARDRVAEQRRSQQRAVPRELPPDVYGFTGRGRELAELDALLESARVVAITGTAGVGKTALAIRWAHRARFPDGCLYVDLRGYDPQQPVRPEHALGWFLRSLGVPGGDIPHDADERASRYRTLLAGRRVLVVADNARDSEQVRPLLPGGTESAMLVTSRDALSGLVVRHGARRLCLDPLTPDEALELLATLIGPRVADEPGDAGSLAQRCVRLPLMLRLVAELAGNRATASLAELDAELADLTQRLDRLDGGGEPTIASRAVFSWSYRHLEAPTARAFRLIGVHPGRDLDEYGLAALLGGSGQTGLATARAALRALSRAHLVQPAGRGKHSRYGMHDLLRAYAAELVATDPDREAAFARLLAHQLHGCTVAMDTLAPFDRARRPAIADPGHPVPRLPDAAAAVGWLDQERPNLVAAALRAADGDGGAHASRLARILVRYLDTAAHHQDAELLYTTAARIADPGARAHALISLGIVCWRLGRYPEAVEHNEQALELARRAGEQPAVGRALVGLGILYWQLGRPHEAVRCCEQAFELYERTGDVIGQARVLGNLGSLHTKLGDYPAAIDHHNRALGLFRQVGDLVGAANELSGLGSVLELSGRFAPALERLQEGLALARQTGYRETEAMLLCNIGIACRRLGRLDQAVAHHEQSLALFRQLGDRAGESYALGCLGAAYELLGRFAEAAELHQRGLRIATEIEDDHLGAELLNHLGNAQLGEARPREALRSFQRALVKARRIANRYEQARAHRGLSTALATAGDERAAARSREQALALFDALGVPEADEVRALAR